ncbi:hypothetical protein [Streptomyces swartbergensis]|uniref:Uncharacterized protein n=1 Tax=Streptomyces swartbergensis TaxID=487165 RepID=A0A243RZY5_9ACTN|nr:hypothetical protein [Streptomyces swartbergensis]OUD00781.1 hypothetical protein CA983_23745 [Streptomyces swartbergensis]
MTRIFASISPLVRPRRALTATALATLVLAGCGSESPSDGGSESKPGSSVGAEKSATSSGPEQAGFMAMLDKIAQPCLETGTGTETGPGPSRKRPTGSAKEGKESLAPGETPPAVPIEPGAPTGPEAELNDRDWCMSVQHEQRIVQALQAVSEPTPAKVRKVLNDLGYIDERIHGLRQDGKVTRFYLDLREKGGRLCEEGLAAGVETDSSACVASAVGPFTVAGPGE